jgi:hypothetical protein
MSSNWIRGGCKDVRAGFSSAASFFATTEGAGQYQQDAQRSALHIICDPAECVCSLTMPGPSTEADAAMSEMESIMLRKMTIVLAVIAMGMTAVHTDAFARGGGGGGGGHGGGGFGGGHMGGGGFGGGHMGAGFSGGRIGGLGGAQFGGAQFGGIHGGFTTRNSGLRSQDRRGFRRGGVGGDWGWCDWPYEYDGYCY